jgi:hypothetical protein
LTPALAIAVAGVLAVGAAPLASSLDPAAERAAYSYLCALVSGDGKTLVRLAPKKPENKFGPCPFTEMPRLTSPRVDLHRAGVLLTGKSRDPALPDHGAVTLTLLDHVKSDPWRVRQVQLFDKLPLGLKVPKRSITKKDQAQEPGVVKTAQRYLAAWMKRDYKTMEHLAFDWLPDVHPVSGMRVRSIQFRAQPSEGGEMKINFTAKATMYRVLPKTLEGTLFAMREDGEWKIRGTELTF